MSDRPAPVPGFRPERCNRCGECFTRCPYLNLSRQEAVEDITRLIEGRDTQAVLQRCISCASCDAFCPEAAEPYSLILGRWDRRYRESGLPVRAEYLLPYTRSNYRRDLVPLMSEREKTLLAQWRAAPLEGELLYPGCNLLTAPALFDLPALAGLPVAGDWSLCCGEPYYRLGAFPVMEKIAARLTDYYAGKPIAKMVFLCPACYNMFHKILPERFGARFSFECEYFVPWLLRRLDSGEIKITHPLNRAVTVHNSCHGRIQGDPITETTRELFRRLGLMPVNPKLHHENGLCCGIAAGCNRQMPQDIVRVGRRALAELAGGGTAEAAIYCTGCYWHLGMIQHLGGPPTRLVHTLELLAEALGQTPARSLEGRTRTMLANVVKKPLLKMLSTRRYWVESLDD